MVCVEGQLAVLVDHGMEPVALMEDSVDTPMTIAMLIKGVSAGLDIASKSHLMVRVEETVVSAALAAHMECVVLKLAGVARTLFIAVSGVKATLDLALLQVLMAGVVQ
jgi:hypothetical protein